MAMIRVRAAGKAEPKRPRTVFDQQVGARLRGSDDRARVIIKNDGVEALVDSTLKVVKEAIERGDLVALDPLPDAPAVMEPKKP